MNSYITLPVYSPTGRLAGSVKWLTAFDSGAWGLFALSAAALVLSIQYSEGSPPLPFPSLPWRPGEVGQIILVHFSLDSHGSNLFRIRLSYKLKAGLLKGQEVLMASTTAIPAVI